MHHVLACVAVVLSGGSSVRAEEQPDVYPAAVFVSGDLAEAVVVAAKRMGFSSGKKCREQLRAHDVHVSREDGQITVIFLPNESCGRLLLGGGGRVQLDAITLKVLAVKPGE